MLNKPLHGESPFGAEGHGAEQPAFGDCIGDLIIHDQFVLGVDGDLDVITDVGDSASTD